MKERTLFQKIQAHKLFSIAVVLLPGLQLVFGQEQKSIQQLEPNRTIEREMAGSQTHLYRFDLQKAELLQVQVEQKGIDVILRLYDAKGNELARRDSPNGDKGFENLSFVADSSAGFVLEVKSLDEKAGKGFYTVHRGASKTATPEDRQKAAMEQDQQTKKDELDKSYKEINDFLNQIDSSTSQGLYEKEINKALRGLEIAQSLKNTDYEAVFLFFTARLFEEKGDTKKELEYYEKAVKAINSNEETKAKLKLLEIIALRKAGRIYDDNLDNHDQGLTLYIQALRLYKESEEDEEKGLILRYVGDALDTLRQFSKAEAAYLKAIGIFERLNLPLEKGVTSGKLGRTYSDQEDKSAEALKYLLESEKLLENSPPFSGYQSTRILNIHTIASLYRGLKDWEKASFYDNKAKQLRDKIKDPYSIFVDYFSLAMELDKTGKFEEAIKAYQKAFDFAKNASIREAPYMQAGVLEKISLLYLKNGEVEEAKKYFDKALDLVAKLKDHASLASLFEGFGDGLFNVGAFKYAVQYYGFSVGILMGAKDHKQTDIEHVTRVQNKWAKAQFENGQSSAALKNLRTSLSTMMAISKKEDLAEALHDRMVIFTKLNNRKLAIFCGKQAVALKQEIRRTIKTFPVGTQKSFLKGNRDTYEKLTGLLIQENRLGEVIQVMNLYQRQEFFDSDNNESYNYGVLSLSKREESARAELQSLQAKMKESPNFLHDPSFHQMPEKFAQFEEAFSQPSDEKDKVANVPDLTEMQAALRELTTATKQKVNGLYTLIGSDKFYLLLISPDKIKVFESPVKAADLNKKILEFYAILRSPDYDPKLLSKELYDVVFKPVEMELRETGAQTLMWLLDGNLRYVPMAALWDGEKYLVERYQNVVFTRLSKERMIQPVSPNWTGYGFATSAPHKVEFSDGTVEFKSLDFVKNEMQIFRTKTYPQGTIEGEVYSESLFNKDSLISALKQRRPLVHISSHFAFRPGDETRSFLLLGDGKIITLAEMKEYENLFQGVELLTLSACDTATQLPNANGREIDAFAELAQRLGARSVMASLWKVRDKSTALLMNDFYRKKQIGKLNKAEALRTSQLGMLYGKQEVVADPASGPSGMAGRGEASVDDIVIEKRYLISFKPDKQKPFAHPHYWSPFILFGNWR